MARNDSRYEEVNTLAWIEPVEVFGPGARNLHEADGLPKRRWINPNPNVENGDLSLINDGEHVSGHWHGLSAWGLDQAGDYGWIYFIFPDEHGELKGTNVVPLKDGDREGVEFSPPGGFYPLVFERAAAVGLIEDPNYRPERGALCALVILGTVSYRRTDLMAWDYDGEEEPEPEPEPDPVPDWPMWEDGEPPIAAMTPIGELGSGEMRYWLDNIYPQTLRWSNASHSPVQDVWLPEYRELAELNGSLLKKRATMFWAGDERTSQSNVKAMTRRIVDETKHTRGWKIVGPCYDVQAYWSTEEVNRWVSESRAYAESIGAERFLFGARALPEYTYHGDFAAHEDHILSVGDARRIFQEERARSGGRMYANTERQRDREPFGPNSKNVHQSKWPELSRVALEEKCGIILGRQGPRGSVSSYGTTRINEPIADEMEVLIHGETPPPPPPPLGPVPRGHGLVAFHGYENEERASLIHEQCPRIVEGPWRVGLGPTILTSYQEWDPTNAVANARRWIEKFPETTPLFGLHDSAGDLSAPQWQEYCYRVIDQMGPQNWCLDAETANPEFVPGGSWEWYCERIDPVMRHIVESGGRTWGPGNTGFGELDHLRAILSNLIQRGILFHQATVHAYPESKPGESWWDRQNESSGFHGYAEMLRRQEQILREHGYEEGWISETGSTGAALGVWQRLSDWWNLRDASDAEKVGVYDRRQKDRIQDLLRMASVGTSFWRGWIYYQIAQAENDPLDRNWGLTRHDGTLKPVADLFR